MRLALCFEGEKKLLKTKLVTLEVELKSEEIFFLFSESRAHDHQHPTLLTYTLTQVARHFKFYDVYELLQGMQLFSSAY